MKNLLLLEVLFLFNLIIVNYVFSSEMLIKQVTSDNLSKEHAFCKCCWYEIYKNCSSKQLGLSNLSQTFKNIFDAEDDFYKNHSEDRLFFHAISNDKIVGYVSFEVRDFYKIKKNKLVNDVCNSLKKSFVDQDQKSILLRKVIFDLCKNHPVYIDQIALLAEFCTTDNMRELIYVIFNFVSNVSCLHIKLNKQATQYINTIKEIGFVELDSGLSADNNFYTLLKMQCNKCGTCMCDLDYSDLSDDSELYVAPLFVGNDESESVTDDFDDSGE